MDFTNLKNFMDYMAYNRTVGNAVEVYYRGKSVFQYASGYSDLENKVQLNGDELFYIYSCSKITTVVAGTQLLEQGHFLLNDPLYEYIPEFREMYIKTTEGNLKKAETPITVGDLFSMTAGFSYDLETNGFKKAKELTNGKMNTVDVIKCVAKDPLCFEPGSRWQYSICHDVLAALISVISGKNFRDYVKENIFDPLNMTQSYYHLNDTIEKRMAKQYCFVGENEQAMNLVEAQKCGNTKEGKFQNVGLSNSFILGEEYDSGGAGIITSVADYAKLMAALANKGTGLTGERILSDYAVTLMQTNRLTPEQLHTFDWPHLAGCGYGLGVRTHISPAQSGVFSNLGEFGWGGAAGATAIIDPSIDLGIFYVQHTLNPRESFYQPRLRNVIYSCL